MTKIKNLALIDDDDVFTFLTKKTIQATNLVELIKVFGNGLEAINFLNENIGNIDELPEVILLDLSMPIMDGWEFLEEFLLMHPKLGKKITIYICSSSISPSDILRAKEITAVSDYIIKPLTTARFVDIIKNLEANF